VGVNIEIPHISAASVMSSNVFSLFIVVSLKSWKSSARWTPGRSATFLVSRRIIRCALNVAHESHPTVVGPSDKPVNHFSNSGSVDALDPKLKYMSSNFRSK
jgi:hypothetical protein